LLQLSYNRTESINNNIKDWIGRAGNLSIPQLDNKIKEVVEAQQQEFMLVGPMNFQTVI
jgi:hypothetical protein